MTITFTHYSPLHILSYQRIFIKYLQPVKNLFTLAVRTKYEHYLQYDIIYLNISIYRIEKNYRRVLLNRIFEKAVTSLCFEHTLPVIVLRKKKRLTGKE